jgi:hypothetical protein
MDLLHCRYAVYNSLGQKMVVETIYHSGKKVGINLNKLGKGLYFLQLTREGNRQTHHVLIKA